MPSERPIVLRSGYQRFEDYKGGYLTVILVGVVLIALVSHFRVRADGFQHVAFWLFTIAFATTLLRESFGLLTTVVLVAVGPALHLQLNALFGWEVKAWAYPGVDACIGFLAAWFFSRRCSWKQASVRYPSTPIILLHLWVLISSVLSAGRNVWQSGSELSLQGLAYNVALVRGINWHDDYYPLQDLFFISVALLLFTTIWSLLLRDGLSLWRRLAFAFLSGAAANAAFGVFQRATGAGWFHDTTRINAFFPDMHSFAAQMAIAILLAFGLLRTGSRTGFSRTAASLFACLCAIGLFLSSSRSVIFLTLFVFAALTAWLAIQNRGWRRAALIGGVAAIGGFAHLALTAGYHGVSYQTFEKLLAASNPEAVELALSFRPEIWRAAMRMYAEFPFFGLGQGEFYRLSSIATFSQSPTLVSYGGENAHNYFLQSFAELGPVGAGLVLLCLLPVMRLSRVNALAASFFGLIGILIGNIYGHALLVREMLMIAAILLAMYYWEAEQSKPDVMRAVSLPFRRPIAIGLGVLFALALVDAATSFQRFPFTYAQRCLEQKSLADDGWASGTYKAGLPEEARHLEVDFSWERPDVAWRPVTFVASVYDADGAVIDRKELLAERPHEPPVTVAFALPLHTNGLTLEVQSSSCYVALNYGVKYDPRRLGFRVRAVRILDDAGRAITPS